MFLISQQLGLPPRQTYGFRPYNWGPYSPELRRDLDNLLAEGLVVTTDVPGYAWKRYHLSKKGLEIARVLLHSAPTVYLRKVAEIKKRVTQLSFNDLLEQVYDEYPEYAEQSLFRS
jgi:uncharacterized protein YwgA